MSGESSSQGTPNLEFLADFATDQAGHVKH
jgi:hypothetical protein